MYSLVQSKRIRGTAGEPLPTVFDSLAERDAHLRRGQLVLVAAGPGTGKSGFILTWALKARVPTLYYSADSDAFTQLTRAVSITTGCTLKESAARVMNNDLEDVEREFAKLPFRFNYAANPTIDDIDLSMESFWHVYGDWPSLVVVDNVTNVIGDRGGDDDPFSGLESLMDYLAGMARNTQACVVGLHHVTGAYNDANKPIPLSGIKGQIGRVPAMVLTLHRQEGISELDDQLCVSLVKNRTGRPDPSGEDYVPLTFWGDTMTIKDPE